MSGVVPYQTTYQSSVHRWAVSANYHEFRAPIEYRDGRVVEEYIHQCWSAYRRLKHKRALNVVFDYLMYADGSRLPAEAKLILLYTAIESLKTTWADSTGIPKVAGYYRRSDSNGRATRSSPKLSFEDLVSEMLGQVKLRRSLRRIVRIRNQLIHTGLIAGSGSEKFMKYGELIAIVHQYLFRLLGYAGEMIHYETQEVSRV